MHTYQDTMFPITVLTNHMEVKGTHIITPIAHKTIKATINITAQHTRYIMIWGILYTISMFNIIYDTKTEANDLHYIPKNKRTWVHGMKASLHNKMEYIIETLYNYTTNWPNPRPNTGGNGLRTHRSHKYMSAAKLITLTTVLAAQSAESRPMATSVSQWDTDSAIIGIENRYSGCMSHLPADFVGDLQNCNRIIKGFGGTRHFRVQIGTLKWYWEDDNGKIHKFLILKSYYIPEG